jgi:hypothetical protein
MKRSSSNVIVLITLSFLTLSSAVAGEIRWKTGHAQLPKLAPDQIAGKISELAARSPARHLVVQFDQPLTPARRQALEASGLRLLSHLGDNAFFASVSVDKLNPLAISDVRSISSMAAIQQSWKLHPFLSDGNLPTWAVVAPPDKIRGETPGLMVATYVLFHGDVPLATDAVRACEQQGAKVCGMLRSVNALVVEVPFSNIRALAAEDDVQWIEPALPKMEGNNDDNRLRTGANIVQAAPYSLDGSGIKVLVYDAGTAYATHPDFGWRVHVRDSSGEHYHSTHVAGTIGGSGAASSGLYRGMAPGVGIESYGLEQAGGLHEGFLYTDPCDIEADYSQAITTYGADIANNSIGTNTAANGYPCDWEGNYGVTDVLIDTIVRGDGGNPLFTSPFRVVWANGNERNSGRCGTTYHTTAPPACAKNHITVGALNSNDDSVTGFTSWGPADDGRMKPDISAPGCQSNGDSGVTSCTTGGGYQVLCGTSMASPTVCGLGALMLQDYRAHYPSKPDFRNSTLKILLAQTAVDLFNPGPDYQTGYGSVRIQPAIDLMRTSNWLEGEVSQAGTVMLLAIVNPGDSQLKVTLAWDDVPGTPNVSPALVNDLDLRVYSPTNVRAYPWTLGGVANPSAAAVRTQENRLDNIEQVFVESPQAGAWRIEVYGFNVPQGPQPFSLVATPQLIACSHTGVITLDRDKYACQTTATIQVVDCDLNMDDGLVETVTINVASTSEPAGEPVVLTETGPQTAAFRGTVPLSTTNGPGILFVAPGDTVTATYVDANNAEGGTGVVVTDTAVVDCTPPVVSGVQVTDIEARAATVIFTTNEPASCLLRYGLTCFSLTDQMAGGGYTTSHTFNLAGLQDNTSYFFVIDATDEAGNSATDNNGGVCYTFTTPEIPDYFTQLFTSDNDLDNLSLKFTPNSSNDFYAGCAEAVTSLPTDPAGGTTISGWTGSSDDGYAQLTVSGGQTVKLYGQSYGTIWVGTNGYVTFGSGDTAYNESYSAHFNKPRIAVLYNDLDPGQGGSVSWKQLTDRVAVTWLNVPHHSVSNQNTFQIEMFFDGTITMSCLAIADTDGLSGLSAGNGQPADFTASDLSTMGACGPQPPTATNVNAATPLSTAVTVTLAATDDGLPEPPAALSYIIATLPAHGSLSEAGVGPIASVPHTLAGRQVIYTPLVDYRPSDTFKFKANDGGTPPGGGDSNEATATISIGGSAFDPVANNVSASIPASAPSNITLNATDPNGDPLTYSIESLPAAGRGLLFDPNGGQITTVPYALLNRGRIVRYIPPFGQTLSASFTYSAKDATAASNIAAVSLTVGVGIPQVVYDFPMNTNPGWNTTGMWAFGHPTGGGTHSRDPNNGYTGTNVCGYDLTGDYIREMPAYYLTTTALNCSTVTGAQLKFWRWLAVDAAVWAHATIEVSNNGTTWTTIWQNNLAVSESAWSQQSYNIASVADNQPTVYLRWGMGPTADDCTPYPGWNIDDVQIWGIVHNSCSGVVEGDLHVDGLVNGLDMQRFVEVLLDPYATGVAFNEFCAADMNADGFVSLDDVGLFVERLLNP